LARQTQKVGGTLGIRSLVIRHFSLKNFLRMLIKLNYICILIVAFILFFLGGWLIPITDPTECVYTLTAKEMLLADDWLSPRIYGDFWYDKPIMFYWELLVAYKIFGVNEFASRFFPAVFATLGLFLTYFFGTKLYNNKVGFAAAIMLATSLEYWYLSHAVITDMTLLVMFSITLMTFYLGYRAGNEKFYLIAFAAAGVSVITKGPIGFFLPGLIILIFLALQGDLAHLKKLFRVKNFVLLVAIVSIWYLPMTLIHGVDFLENFLGVHNFLRATVSEYPKNDVWYYYTLISLIGFFPWSILLIYGAIKNYRQLPKLDVPDKFLLVWALTVIIFFQMCATKYVTYTLPAMIPAIILAARYFVNRWKMFIRVATSLLIIYPLVMFTVVLPITEDNSGRNEAELLSMLTDDNTCVVSHGKVYPASLVFYTGKKIYRLETQETYKKIRPQKMSWTSKNVMPFMTFDELPVDKKIVAVVNINYTKSFLDNAAGKWKLVAEVPRSTFETLIENIFYGRERQEFKTKFYMRIKN